MPLPPECKCGWKEVSERSRKRAGERQSGSERRTRHLTQKDGRRASKDGQKLQQQPTRLPSPPRLYDSHSQVCRTFVCLRKQGSSCRETQRHSLPCLQSSECASQLPNDACCSQRWSCAVPVSLSGSFPPSPSAAEAESATSERREAESHGGTNDSANEVWKVNSRCVRECTQNNSYPSESCERVPSD